MLDLDRDLSIGCGSVENLNLISSYRVLSAHCISTSVEYQVENRDSNFDEKSG